MKHQVLARWCTTMHGTTQRHYFAMHAVHDYLQISKFWNNFPRLPFSATKNVKWPHQTKGNAIHSQTSGKLDITRNASQSQLAHTSGGIASWGKCYSYFSVNEIVENTLNVHLGINCYQIQFLEKLMQTAGSNCMKWEKTLRGWTERSTANHFATLSEMQLWMFI